VKFGNFLFPDSSDPGQDGIVIDETLREAVLSDELGMDAIWLGEHHFDGICAYVDPIAFAGVLAAATRRSMLGFAVIQTALHHPIRLAEQLALIDNLTKGRLIVGLGRGTAYNIYDYQGFGINHEEAQARLDESEIIIRRAWTEGAFTHEGRFWQLKVPMLRPRPYAQPHPPILRGASGEHSLIELAHQGRPFLMNVQSLETTRHRVGLYSDAMREAGYDEAAIARNLDQSWVWRNIYVAPTDAEAERVGLPALQETGRRRSAMRERIFAETGQRIVVPKTDLPEARANPAAGLMRGSPATVAEAIAGIASLGIGGILSSYRIGPLTHRQATDSLRLFMAEVAPQFHERPAAGTISASRRSA
jgi:alkanesulfonate monooxygenase SsuD/methylene tetrahydromethanopterin reductase-like flavin-dependent oxidoreductase (luciferase family)